MKTKIETKYKKLKKENKILKANFILLRKTYVNKMVLVRAFAGRYLTNEQKQKLGFI
jgi:hypothetical protein